VECPGRYHSGAGDLSRLRRTGITFFFAAFAASLIFWDAVRDMAMILPIALLVVLL